MKITKFVHSCLLVETPERAAIFDPGLMSELALDINALQRLDDIFITHDHGDHLSLLLIKQLVVKFPQLRITTTPAAVEKLRAVGIAASHMSPTGVEFFTAPHEEARPLFDLPEQIGIHYLDVLTNPGDSHSFNETRAILVLPITAPWGATTTALQLALRLKPKYVLPVHDWHWRDEARQMTYDAFEHILADAAIKFCKLETGQPAEVTI